jgi:hypothetical protein
MRTMDVPEIAAREVLRSQFAGRIDATAQFGDPIDFDIEADHWRTGAGECARNPRRYSSLACAGEGIAKSAMPVTKS